MTKNHHWARVPSRLLGKKETNEIRNLQLQFLLTFCTLVRMLFKWALLPAVSGWFQPIRLVDVPRWSGSVEPDPPSFLHRCCFLWVAFSQKMCRCLGDPSMVPIGSRDFLSNFIHKGGPSTENSLYDTPLWSPKYPYRNYSFHWIHWSLLHSLV